MWKINKWYNIEERRKKEDQNKWNSDTVLRQGSDHCIFLNMQWSDAFYLKWSLLDKPLKESYRQPFSTNWCSKQPWLPIYVLTLQPALPRLSKTFCNRNELHAYVIFSSLNHLFSFHDALNGHGNQKTALSYHIEEMRTCGVLEPKVSAFYSTSSPSSVKLGALYGRLPIPHWRSC